MLLAALSPLALVGAVVHYPAYLLSGGLAKTYRTHGVDEIVSTVKVLAAIALMPLTWVIVTAMAYALWNWRAAVVTFPVVIICGYVAMRFVEEVHDMRGWYKAVVALLRRRGLFLRLLLERRALHSEIKRLEVPQETERL